MQDLGSKALALDCNMVAVEGQALAKQVPLELRQRKRLTRVQKDKEDTIRGLRMIGSPEARNVKRRSPMWCEMLGEGNTFL